MIVWLDHEIFGNGRGLKSPGCDNTFYWLNGEFYTSMMGFGAQLHSVQWTHPRAGETRMLNGRQYRPFHSHRRWGRVRVAWATDLGDSNNQLETLREIKRELQEI